MTILPTDKLLRVEAPHFCAGAIFRSSPWRCVGAAPILKWMINKPPAEIAEYMKRKGWRYAWH